MYLFSWVGVPEPPADNTPHIIVQLFQLNTQKPNNETLVNSYKPTSPDSLFSKYQYCSGIRFIGPSEMPLWSIPCIVQVWSICKHIRYYVLHRILQNRKKRRHQWGISLLGVASSSSCYPWLWKILRIT